MKAHWIIAFFILAMACKPAAAPTNIASRPSSVNGIPIETFPPNKPIDQMSWVILDAETNRDKEIQKLRDFRGKVLILDFWATYCPPCIEEIPYLKELQRKYGQDKLQIIGLHVGGKDDRPNVPDFHRKLNIDYPIATPEEELVRFVFGPNSEIPQTAIFDKDGRFVKKFIGFDESKKQEIERTLERLMSEK